MAVYKVPQDVEAEDKLLGPFSFKQFIFLIIAVASIGVAYALSQIFIGLAVIPLPFVIFFGALALPLRKDQPMEVYLAAVISFILKPKNRLWQPDGIESLIEVIAPKVDDRLYGKGYSQEEVHRRLSYLANIVDSRGWSVRGATEPDSSMQTDLYNEAQAVDDLLDDNSTRSQQIDDLLTRTDNERRQQIMNQMRQPQQNVTQQQIPPPVAPSPESQQIFSQQPQIMSPPYTPMMVVQPSVPDEAITLAINPYPTMNQSIISPLSEQPTTVAPQPVAAPSPPLAPAATPEPVITEPAPPSEEVISPAIIDLANNHNDLSVATLQREAERIKKRELEESEEIVISLR